MKRTAILALLVSAALLVVFAWQEVARQRDYARLIADGDRALAADETFPAVEAYTGAVTLRPNAMLAYLKRGEAYLKRGEPGEAFRDLRKAAELDPSATRPLEVLGDLNLSLERHARAQESYEAYLRLDDRSPRVLYKLALTRYRLGSPQGAVRPLRQALAIDDRFAPGHYLLGLCLADMQEAAEATAALERAVRLDPSLVPAREKLAEAYVASHRNQEAVAQFEALAELEPGRLERKIALGLGHARAGRFDLAVTTLRRVTEEHPEDPRAYVAVGRVWLEAAEDQRDRIALGKATEALETAIRRSPPNSEALMYLGRARLLSGDVAAAEQAFKQATVQFPIEHAAFLHLADAAERAGHFATARDALARYTAISGDGAMPPDRAFHMGELSMRLSEPAIAAGWYAKAAASPSASGAVFARLAEAQWRAGDRVAALASAQRGLQRDPGNRDLIAIDRRIRAAAAGIR